MHESSSTRPESDSPQSPDWLNIATLAGDDFYDERDRTIADALAIVDAVKALAERTWRLATLHNLNGLPDAVYFHAAETVGYDQAQSLVKSLAEVLDAAADGAVNPGAQVRADELDEAAGRARELSKVAPDREAPQIDTEPDEEFKVPAWLNLAEVGLPDTYRRDVVDLAELAMAAVAPVEALVAKYHATPSAYSFDLPDNVAEAIEDATGHSAIVCLMASLDHAVSTVNYPPKPTEPAKSLASLSNDAAPIGRFLNSRAADDAREETV